MTDRPPARCAHSLRVRSRILDVGMQVHERDQEAAGTLLGSALALRLFLFFLPLVLLVIGIVGLLGRFGEVDSASEVLSVGGSLAVEIDDALEQGGRTPWPALGTAVIGMSTTGRSPTRALVLSSAQSWGMTARQKTPLRVIGIVIGLVVGMGAASIVVNRLREAGGAAVTGISCGVMALVYAVL